MSPAYAKQIASAYLPSRRHYYYSRSKLSSDPLYDGVCAALTQSFVPVLDLGCGIGMLAHCLRIRQMNMPYLGVDNDVGKVQLARRSALALTDVKFDVADLATAVPEHRGSVAILDLLQFLPVDAQLPFLHRACECVGEGGRLVIRTGLTDATWRSKVTRAVDVFSRVIRWMNVGPQRYPDRDHMNQVFVSQGLTATYQPLWGRTPFNNWLITAVR
jgi:SAM-dependent methyltransferase